MIAVAAVVCLTLSAPVGHSQDAHGATLRAVVKKVFPTYPSLAYKGRLQGVVKLSVKVSPGGQVKAVEVLGGNPVLTQAAVAGVQQWKWEPGPSETVEPVRITFETSGDVR